MNSAAYAAQPDHSKVVLFAVACRYHGRNNGDLSLPFSEAKKLGVAHQWKLYAGLQLLLKAGLVDRTRQGMLERGIKLPSLYALTWRGVDKPPDGVGYDAGISVCPIPRHDWAKWVAPENWASIVREIATANHGQKKPSKLLNSKTKKNPVSTTVGNGRSTTVGATATHIAQLPGGMETVSIAPTVVVSSKILGQHHRNNSVLEPAMTSGSQPLSRAVANTTELTGKKADSPASIAIQSIREKTRFARRTT